MKFQQQTIINIIKEEYINFLNEQESRDAAGGSTWNPEDARSMLGFLMSNQAMSDLFTILNDLPIDKRRKFIQYQNIFTRDFLADYTTKDGQSRAITWLRTQVPDDIQEPLTSFVVKVNRQAKSMSDGDRLTNVSLVRKIHNTFTSVSSDLSKLDTAYLGKETSW